LPSTKTLKEPRVDRSAREGWRGRSYSFKAGGVVRWNGRLVEAAILEADADASVTRLVAGPLTLQYLTPLGWRTKSPDLLIMRGEEPWLVDCTWEQTATRPGQEDRWADIGVACASIGFGYEVWTELHLERRSRAKNVEAISRARTDEPCDASTRKSVLDMIEHEGASINDCVSSLSIPRSVIYRLILEGFVYVDLDAKLVEAPLALGSGGRS
jgi:hypothetical protein